MRSWKDWILFAMALCMVLSLCACAAEGSETVPTGTTGSTAPSVPSETVTVPTEAPADPLELYRAAAAALNEAPNWVIDFTITQQRIVGGEIYTENRTGTASYAGRNSEEATALVAETFTCGSYSTQYIESYLNGSGWCRVNNCNFRCDMTAEAFLAQQLPGLLLDSSLYSSVTAEETGDGLTLLFNGAANPESWVADAENAELAVARGTLTLDSNGQINAGSYHAQYSKMGTAYSLDVTVQISTPQSLDFSAQQPVYPEESAVISDLQIPRYLLRVVGDVYTSRNMSVTYSDTMTSQAFGRIRTQVSTYNTYGSGDGFMASLHNQVTLTDPIGATVTTTQVSTFRDGLYSYRYNDGDLTTDSNMTAAQIRTSWEDSILSALIMMNYIAGATIEDAGDTLYITFTGNDTFARSLCSGIYALFGMDLDSYATSYSTQYINGYLTIDKATGLPTAMGMGLSRSHVINSITYQLTYQLDQTLELSSPNAHGNITGEPAVSQ